MSDSRYLVCAPSVVGEVIDGEAIVMDLKSGSYFSADGLGAVIWQAIEQGAGRAQIQAWASTTYPGEQAVEADVDAFLQDLLSHQLIRGVDVAGATPQLETPAAAYAAPKLNVHHDMQDLILLDPIHDVDEVGWPTRKVDAD